MRIVWDLDGVLRDLSTGVINKFGGDYPDKWNHVFASGKKMCDTINNNMEILVQAPPTAYCSVAKKFCDPIEIWTSQAPAWREHTTKWVEEHLGICDIHFLTREEKAKRLDEFPDAVLIEDSPCFKSYKSIILIDRPYNQNVKKAFRIFGTKHLINVFEMLEENDE